MNLQRFIHEIITFRYIYFNKNDNELQAFKNIIFNNINPAVGLFIDVITMPF